MTDHLCVSYNRDNPETDIYGGNLYNQYLRKRQLQHELQKSTNKTDALNIKRKLRMAQVYYTLLQRDFSLNVMLCHVAPQGI